MEPGRSCRRASVEMLWQISGRGFIANAVFLFPGRMLSGIFYICLGKGFPYRQRNLLYREM